MSPPASTVVTVEGSPIGVGLVAHLLLAVEPGSHYTGAVRLPGGEWRGEIVIPGTDPDLIARLDLVTGRIALYDSARIVDWHTAPDF